MTCHDTNYNTGLLYPLLKQITITKNNRIFSFLYIVFYWKNNLELCFSLADTGVKGLLKYEISIKDRFPCLFSDLLIADRTLRLSAQR